MWPCLAADGWPTPVNNVFFDYKNCIDLLQSSEEKKVSDIHILDVAAALCIEYCVNAKDYTRQAVLTQRKVIPLLILFFYGALNQ